MVEDAAGEPATVKKRKERGKIEEEQNWALASEESEKLSQKSSSTAWV